MSNIGASNVMNSNMKQVSVDDFNALIRAYGVEYVRLLDDTCDTYDRIRKGIAFVENVSLQACHEHLRVQYKMLFETCLKDYYVITEGIDEFPSIVDKHCHNAQRIGTLQQKDSCKDFLDTLLSYHNACAGNLKSRVEFLEKRGNDVYALTSLLPKNVCR